MTARRRSAWIAGTILALLLVTGGTAWLFSGLAIADEPGRSLDVEPVTVPTGTAVEPTPSPSTSGSPELVPAPSPVVVDDHGGDRPGQDDDSGSDDSGGDSSGHGSD